ncbi:MAG TPA: OB-fold domain-containing protein [Stellaceae bacterium]|nr:OB-fold domain-containing protein [Stellaceae bacterium]
MPSSIPKRILPRPTALTEAFWRGGADGRLRIACCRTCGLYLHPPVPICRACLGREIGFEPVSGHAVVESFTVNHQAWRPDLAEPYVIAVVELVEQPGLRLTTNIVGCDPAEVFVGQAVVVTFEAVEDLFLPLFRPD